MDLTKRSGVEGGGGYGSVENWAYHRPTDPYYSQFADTSHLVGWNKRAFVGWDTPNYHKRRRNGELLPMTPWYQYKATGSASGSYSITTVDTTATPDQYADWYSVGTEWVPSESWALDEEHICIHIPDKYDQYVQEAAAKIYSQGHDTLTCLAELTQLKSLFEVIAKRLIKRKLPKKLKEVTGDWLATRYGLRPLIYDIESLNEAIKNLNDGRTRYSEKAGSTTSYSYLDEVTDSKSCYSLVHRFTDKVKVGLRGSVVADVDVPEFQFNPLQTGWELIPFSFVFDWFVNVGKTLAAVSLLSLDMDYVASKGYRIDVTREYSVYITDTWGIYHAGTVDVTGTCTGYIEVRTPCRIPILPHFIVKLNSLKILDLIALLLQQIRR